MTLSSTRIRFSSCTIRRVGSAIDVHNHGNISKKIDLVKDFAESEKMELNLKKW